MISCLHLKYKMRFKSTGWESNHLAHNETHGLCHFIKNNSHGEFVFIILGHMHLIGPASTTPF